MSDLLGAFRIKQPGILSLTGIPKMLLLLSRWEYTYVHVQSFIRVFVFSHMLKLSCYIPYYFITQPTVQNLNKELVFQTPFTSLCQMVEYVLENNIRNFVSGIWYPSLWYLSYCPIRYLHFWGWNSRTSDETRLTRWLPNASKWYCKRHTVWLRRRWVS